ncbi:hypothetical protein KPH14_002501 [Odynerus spinipes]|uniref:C2H2-type domain-containing protein n=1 Tax=Odynerus spinipes TaxID=1348599 RepID=A0AAD9RSN2_9HYME|nr:hypothetical protein KPH14_002501 [Odynerus spinipes]
MERIFYLLAFLSGYWPQMYLDPAMNAYVGQGQMMITPSTIGNRASYQPVGTRTRGQSTYKCPNCDRFYMRTSCLKRHLRVECGQQPQYQCRICQGWFKYKHNLSAHMKLHMEEPKHHCTICPKKFYRRDKLVEHEKRAHRVYPG